MTGECRYCGAAISRADDGAWEDESGACGCGAGEHEPGGFNAYAHAERARETPWWDDADRVTPCPTESATD